MSPVRQSPDPLPLNGFSSGLWSQCLVLHMMKQMSVDSASSPSRDKTSVELAPSPSHDKTNKYEVNA